MGNLLTATDGEHMATFRLIKKLFSYEESEATGATDYQDWTPFRMRVGVHSWLFGLPKPSWDIHGVEADRLHVGPSGVYVLFIFITLS
jgi:hypothetical protein